MAQWEKGTYRGAGASHRLDLDGSGPDMVRLLSPKFRLKDGNGSYVVAGFGTQVFGGSGGASPPVEQPAAPSFTRPTTPVIGTQQFILHGREDRDYSARIYSDGRYRFEVRQGEQETWDSGDPVERSQWSAGEHTASRHPDNWSVSNNVASIPYMIRTKFVWTPIQNIPGNANWQLVWEWHHMNEQVGNNALAPVRILMDTVGANKPLALIFGNYPSRSAQLAGGAPTYTRVDLAANVVQGKPYTFEEEVQFHEVNGIYRLWMDGVKVFERTSGMVGYANTAHYTEFGIYRATTPEDAVAEFTFPDPAKIFARIPVTETVATPTPPAAPATNVLTAPSNFSNAAWIKTRATVTNAGAANQALMETAVTNNHYVTQTVAKPAVAAKYRLQFDAIGDLGRSWVMGSVYNADYSGECSCFFDVANNVIGNHFAYGGPQETGTSTVTDMGGGVKRCTMDFIHDTSTSLILTLFIASADDTTNYAGDVTKGLKLTNVKIGTI